LSDVAGQADWNDDVVEGGSVGRREIGVRAVTLLDHFALVARLFARLTVTKLKSHNRCNFMVYGQLIAGQLIAGQLSADS